MGRIFMSDKLDTAIDNLGTEPVGKEAAPTAVMPQMRQMAAAGGALVAQVPTLSTVCEDGFSSTLRERTIWIAPAIVAGAAGSVAILSEGSAVWVGIDSRTSSSAAGILATGATGGAILGGAVGLVVGTAQGIREELKAA
jgi:hypothetical protein